MSFLINSAPATKRITFPRAELDGIAGSSLSFAGANPVAVLVLRPSEMLTIAKLGRALLETSQPSSAVRL
jgi:hypothetical protein